MTSLQSPALKYMITDKNLFLITVTRSPFVRIIGRNS